MICILIAVRVIAQQQQKCENKEDEFFPQHKFSSIKAGKGVWNRRVEGVYI